MTKHFEEEKTAKCLFRGRKLSSWILSQKILQEKTFSDRDYKDEKDLFLHSIHK